MTLKLKAFKKTAVASALTAATLFTSVAAQAEMLRMGMVTPPSHIWNKVAEQFDQNLQEATGGEDKIKVFPLGKLGGEQQMIDLLQSGGMQLAILTAGGLSNREDSFNAWFLPGLFADVSDAAAATSGSEAQAMLGRLDEHKLVGLGYAFAGMRHVLSLEPMTASADFANKKIRSFPNKVFNDWWHALEAAPTALPTSEVTPALNTNLLDAVDVDLDLVVGLKMYQQAPNLTLTNHMAFPGVVVASKRWWDGLSADKQQQVMQAFKSAEGWGFEQQAIAEVANLEKLKQEGVKVAEFDLTTLNSVVEAITTQYVDSNEGIRAFYEQNK